MIGGESMKLKVFKLKDGKLEYKGIREVQQGDAIVEGETSMAETVHLRESKADDPDEAALRTAFKRAMPCISEQGLDAAVNKGKPPAQTKGLEDSIRRANPDWTDQQVQTFMRGR
jgi:hypothetical protein